jgi:dextranase
MTGGSGLHRMVSIASFRPRRPWFRPGTAAEVEIGLVSRAAKTVVATVTLLDADVTVGRATARFRLRPGRTTRTVRIALPAALRHGYGLHLEMTWVEGRAVADSAVEALQGWWESPRHAAITRFRSGARTAAAVRALRDWHVTVVQLYDWMYRHYRYEPPGGTSFVDSLGQRVSHDAVRAGITAGRSAGIASLAYGSVYGAEREYVDAHPDERVFDADGRPLSLGETFYINDLRPGRPWRQRLMHEYARTCRRFGVDGIHMDTYGPPHEAVAADGERIDFAALYPGLIAEGAATVARARPGARVLFNCVEGFPVAHVAAAPAAALYLELWPPDVTYGDVVRWIDRARSLGGGRAVVIAAYISALRKFEHDPIRRAGSVEAAVLLTSIVFAAGAYHHVLAADDRLLVEGYYPEARPLRARERAELRAAWAFSARYVHLLSDPGSTMHVPHGLRLMSDLGAPIPWTETPRAGAVWARLTQVGDGSRILSLVDLLDQADDRWDEARSASPRRRGWSAHWESGAPNHQVAASPWTAAGAAQRVTNGRLPSFRRWMIVIDRPTRDPDH